MDIIPTGEMHPNSLAAWAALDKKKYLRESYIMLKKYGPGTRHEIVRRVQAMPDDPDLPANLHFHSMPETAWARAANNIYARLTTLKRFGYAVTKTSKVDEASQSLNMVYEVNPEPPVEVPRVLSLRMLLDNIERWEQCVSTFRALDPNRTFTLDDVDGMLLDIQTPQQPTRERKRPPAEQP